MLNRRGDVKVGDKESEESSESEEEEESGSGDTSDYSR